MAWLSPTRRVELMNDNEITTKYNVIVEYFVRNSNVFFRKNPINDSSFTIIIIYC